MRWLRAVLVTFVCALILETHAFHPDGVDHEADLLCHVCNASYYCLNGQQFDCPAHSLAAVALADTIDECVCLPGYLREGDLCNLGQPPAWYMYGNRSFCVHTRETIAAGASGHADCVCVPGFAGLPAAEPVHCEACPADTFADVHNTSECVPCPAYASHNETRRANVTACLCDPGYTGPDGGPCVACAAGTFKAQPGAAACEDCGVNEYSYSAAAVCVACHANSSSLSRSPGVDHCLCDPGFYPSEGLCSMCHAGRFKNTTANEPCQSCTGNTFASELGATACTSCLVSSPFSTANPSEGGIRCQCIAGYTQTELNLTTPACSACPPDTFQPSQGQTTCELCDPNARSPEASVTPLACLCNAGFADDSEHECLVCAGGTYKEAAADDEDDTELCNVCPDDSFSLAQSGRLVDCLCDPGFSGPDGGPCAACAPGKFKAANGSAACEDCPLHTYSDAPHSTACKSCTQFLDFGGITLAPGQNSSDACQCDVSQGFSTVYINGARKCTGCEAGTYATSTGCRNCSNGTYNDQGGQTTCKLCPANTRSYDQPHISCQCDKGFKCFNSNFRKMSVKQPADNTCQNPLRFESPQQCENTDYNVAMWSQDYKSGDYRLLRVYGLNSPQNGFEEFNDFTSFYYNISFPYVTKDGEGYERGWHRDINEMLCAMQSPPWGTYCALKSGGGYTSMCPTQACINPWGNCRCYTKIIDSSLTGVWPTRGVAQRFEQLLPQCIIEESGRINNPACQHCDMNTPSRTVYRNSDPVQDYGGDGGIYTAKGNCPAFVLKLYAVGTSWARWLWLTCSYAGNTGMKCYEFNGNVANIGSSVHPPANILHFFNEDPAVCPGKCEACPVNTFKDYTGPAGSCSFCQANSEAPPASTSQDMCLCKRGYRQDGPTVCVACAAGTYSDDLDELACSVCPADTYTPTASYPWDTPGDCQACAVCNQTTNPAFRDHYDAARAGLGCGLDQATDCQPCPASASLFLPTTEFQRNKGVQSCVCDAHFYGAKGTACAACPSNQIRPDFIDAATTLADCLCAPGFEPDPATANLCRACAIGKYKTYAGDHNCTACPATLTTAQTGNANASACACAPGFAFDGDECNMCPDNLYKIGFNLIQACTACTANSFGAVGGTGPLDCSCLSGFEANAPECLQCQTGKYRNDSVNLGIANAHVLASREINLARACSGGDCPTFASSVWGGEARYQSSKLVDGDLSSGNTFQSSPQPQPWVKIDMQTTVYVRRVRIYNRGDCCQWRLDNFEIRIGNDPTFLNNAVCVTAQPTYSGFKDFTCVMSGRYISLQVLHNDGHLMFREFEVYGTKLDLDPTLYLCSMCPLNTATNNTASHVCAACAAGKTTDGRTGQVECVCAVGTEPGTEPGAGGACQTCRAGTYKAASTDKYANRACVNCSSCAANQQVATECNSTHNITCRACQANSWSSAGRTLLDPCFCNAGYELQGELCVACPVGKARQANYNNSIRCEVCGPGFANTSAQATCHPCSGICLHQVCRQITYDFSRADINDLQSWKNYAASIGATTFLDGYTTNYGGAVAVNGGGPEHIGYIQLPLPEEYSHVTVYYNNPFFQDQVRLLINGVVVQTATAGQSREYSQTYTSGTVLRIDEQACVIGKNIKIILKLFCDPYVRQECNASRDVVCQQCQTCPPGQYANNTCGVSYGNDRLDTQCAVCPADSYCPGGSVTQAALPCPDNGKSAPGSDAIADCTCDPGFYRSGDLCVICPLDAYCPRGVFQPIACPAPGRTFYEGSAVRLDCHCPRGHFRDPPGDEERFNCSLCTPDDYCFNNSLYNCSDALMESEPGSGFFDNCTCVNRYYNNGTRCDDCNVDFSCVGGRQHACPALEWTNRLTRQEACVCRPSLVRAGAECVPCADDFFCDGSDDREHPCPSSSLGRAATNVSECLCNVSFEVVHSNNVSEPHSCRECSLHFFKNSISNTLCQPCTRCLPASDSVWTRIVCDAGYDAMCDSCTVCHDPAAADTPAEQWAGVDCQEFADTVCFNCTLCDYSEQWEKAPCAETRDRECSAIQRGRPCEVGQYAGNHSRTTDSQCLPCAMNDTLYEGQRLHFYTSAGRRYDDLTSCDIACRPYSRLRDINNPALGCVSCETGNVLFKVFTQNDLACTFTCLEGYVRTEDDCVLAPLQPSVSNFWNHTLNVTHVRRVSSNAGAAFRFTISHTAHGSFAVVIGRAEPSCASLAPVLLHGTTACCFSGLWRVSTKNQLGLGSSAEEKCSAPNAPFSARLSDSQLEFDVPDSRLTELALCNGGQNSSFGELACVLQVSIVDTVFLLHVAVAVTLELRRGAALAFMPGAHTYVPLLAFHAEVQLAYMDAGRPVFLVVNDLAPLPDAGATQVGLASALERVDALPGVNCGRYTLNSDFQNTAQWTLDGGPARASVLLRADVATSDNLVLKLYYTLRLLEREGGAEDAASRNTMNVAVWRNVSLDHAVCETTPPPLTVRMGEVLTFSGLGAYAASTATALHEPTETVRGELGGLTTFVARALVAHVRRVHPASLLAAFTLPAAAPLLAGVLGNVTMLQGGRLDFTDSFRAACGSSEYCHLRYIYGRGVHYMSSCDDAAQDSARAWLRVALGVVHDAGHVEAACALAHAPSTAYAYEIVLVNTRAYMPRTAQWHALQNHSAPESTSRLYMLFEFI